MIECRQLNLDVSWREFKVIYDENSTYKTQREFKAIKSSYHAAMAKKKKKRAQVKPSSSNNGGYFKYRRERWAGIVEENEDQDVALSASAVHQACATEWNAMSMDEQAKVLTLALALTLTCDIGCFMSS